MSADRQIRSIVNRLNQTVFRSHVNDTQIRKLERSANSGEYTTSLDCRIRAQPKAHPNSLTLYLKNQHKFTGKGVHIQKLPKQPFGRHINYNKEKSFKDDHFIEVDSLDMLKNNKDFGLLTRQFKSVKKEKNQPVIRNRSQSQEDIALYKMAAGNLFCKKEGEIERIYEENRSKYSRLNKYNAVPYSLNRTAIKPETDVWSIVKRLHPANNFMGNQKCQQFSRRYSLLFDGQSRKLSK